MCFSAIATIAWLPKLANPLFSKKVVRRSLHAHLENVMTILREGLQSDSYFPIVFPVAWGRSSAGRALDWQSRGQGFDPPRLHHSTSYGLRIRGPFCYHGLMAQRLAQGTHNPWVAGSNPAGPTMHIWPGGGSFGPFASQLFQLRSFNSLNPAYFYGPVNLHAELRNKEAISGSYCVIRHASFPEHGLRS